jgi:hypothetical protein
MRQHQTALLWAGIAVAVAAVALAATGIPIHQLAAREGLAWQDARKSVDNGLLQAFTLVLQLFPVLAGMFLGAPLLPREIEHGTARLAWTQAASRPRWLLAQVLPVAALLALAAAALGAEFSWWQGPFPGSNSDSVHSGAWSPQLFGLSPLPAAGWAVFAFTLGVFLGAAARRTLPAMAATLLCYGAVLYEVAYSWRMHYLTPLRRSFAVTIHSAQSYNWGGYRGHQQPVDISIPSLGWRDGRLLSPPELAQPAAWLRAHHIVTWVTYQPASRYHTFQLIELGWLAAASALLIAAAVFLIRRRPA